MEFFLLSYFWHETNIEFFYEFFDKFDKYNKSFCFENNKGKPEFGSYCPSVFTASLEVFFLQSVIFYLVCPSKRL